MKTSNDMISILSENLSPVISQKPFRRLLMYTLITCLLTMTLVLAFFSVRPDLREMLSNDIFIFSTLSTFTISLTTFFFIIYSSVPGRSVARTVCIIGAMASILWIGLLLWPNESMIFGQQPAIHCTFSAIALGLTSFVMFCYAVKKAAPVRPVVTGVLCGLAATTIGATALAFSCPNENVYHLLVWHLALPTVFFLSIGQVVGRTVFRW